MTKVMGMALRVKRGQLAGQAKSVISPRAISVYGPSRLVVEPDSSKATGSRSGASLAVVKVSPVTMVAPTAGLTWNPVAGLLP